MPTNRERTRAQQGEDVGWSILMTTTTSSDTRLYPNIKANKNIPHDLAEEIDISTEQLGAVIYILEKDNKINYATNNFYLTGLQINLKERVQLLESFDASTVSFFDEAARVYNISGLVLEANSQDSNYYGKYLYQSSLIKLYNSNLRGSKLLDSGAIAVLKVKNHLIYGYPLNFTSAMNSASDKVVSFSMNWLVISHELSQAGVVSDTDLEMMYNNWANNNSYIQNIDTVLTLLDNILNMGKYPTNPEGKFIKLFNTFDVNALSYNALMAIDDPSEVTNIINTQVAALASKIKEYLEASLEGTDVSGAAIILKYFPASLSEVDALFDTAKASISNMITKGATDISGNSAVSTFDKAKEFFSLLQLFRNELLTFKARLVY